MFVREGWSDLFFQIGPNVAAGGFSGGIFI